jgi:hypothetical protein
VYDRGDRDNPVLNAAELAIEAHYCEDIDECTYKPVCSADSTCVNTMGSFHCDCAQGFSNYFDPVFGVFLGCVDDDECKLNSGLGPCATLGGLCRNKRGSVDCMCQNGFNGSGSSLLFYFHHQYSRKTCADVLFSLYYKH